MVLLSIDWTNLHELLRSLYDEMMPLCEDMASVAKGVAGIGALFYVAYRVWQSLARAEEIDVFPLFRPFVLGLCIMFFPTLVLGTINGILSPVCSATSSLVEQQTFDMKKYQEEKDELEREAMLRDPAKAFLVSDEEFDYIYYTYGLEHYGNLPLIEPLEYREVRKVREFVVAVDTSASCRGPVVRGFLRKTYSLLKASENFFHKVNIHIIQCDSQIRSDTKITCDDDFEAFMKYGKLNGFGATDFRPVFSYVEELCRQGEFENLKGLIYFTDGYGIYPERMPDYKVIFAFPEEDENRSPVPPWSMKVVLEPEE